MNKILVSSLVTLALFGAQIASAQSAYSLYNYGSTYSGVCVNLTENLSYGSQNAQVVQLQRFLVAQNYPGGGSWMETGYFGAATQAALRDFQQSEGLSTSGMLDSATLTAINRVSCPSGQSGVSQIVYSNGYNTVTPNNFNTYYNYNNNYPYNNYSGTLALISLSQNTGAPGTAVTVYGTGFDSINNTIIFGTQTLAGIPSQNGTSLTFTVPTYGYSYAASESVQFYVTNSHGTSNSLAFSVTQYGYGYNSCGGYSYGYSYSGYNNNCYVPPVNNNLTSPTVTYLNPSSGGAGTSVTVFGSGFSTSGNTVHFGAGVITNLGSADGQSVSFIVPSQLVGFGSQVLTIGTYNVSVTNSGGYTSNSVPFTVTSLISGGAPTITGVNGPTSLTTGAQGTWTITINNPSNSYVTTNVVWGDAGSYYNSANQAASQVTYAQGTATLSFTHTYYAGGTYQVNFTVSNVSGQSNTSSASVYVSGSGTGVGNGSVTLSYLTPTAGYPGTQVMIQGSGFTALDNTVHFGVGGTQHIPSNNGTTLYFTIPSYVTPCDITASGSVCSMLAQAITPGSYSLYITNANGTSQTLTFQVQ